MDLPPRLAMHPRLLVTPTCIARLKHPIALKWLKGVEDWVKERSEDWVKMSPFTHLNKAEFGYCTYIGREHEMRVTALAIRWLQTGEERFRQGVIRHIRFLKEEDPWSEVFGGSREFDPNTCFDLNHGERALTVALAYDWLYGSLSEDEKRLFLEVATTYLFNPAIRNCREGGAWWYAMAHNNWNGVCAGGLGILCLSMYDDSELARDLLTRVEHSLGIFMRAHADNSGASEEGTGYWNYGLRYAGLYLRSWEEATGTRHPLLEQPWLEQSLSFPLDFSPNGLDVGFGDIPGFGQPLPFHYEIARSRGFERVVRRIDARLRKNPYPVPSTNTGTGLNYFNAFEGATPLWLLVHTRQETPPPDVEEKMVRVIPGLDWGYLADRMPDPHLYMSVRGGNSGAAHAHDDLLSFHCCVGDEILVGNPKPSKYLPTTFTNRRGEIPDINPQFKNTLLINGVGIYHDTRTDSVARVEGAGWEGIRMVVTTAFTTPKGAQKPRNMSNLNFVGRLFVMLDHAAWLVVDSIYSAKGGPFLCEARYHTYAGLEKERRGVLLTGRKERLRIAFASNMPSAFLATTTTAPTTARDPVATMLRWHSDEFLSAIAPRTTILAALLTPGVEATSLAVRERDGEVDLDCGINGKTMNLRFTRELEPR